MCRVIEYPCQIRSCERWKPVDTVKIEFNVCCICSEFVGFSMFNKKYTGKISSNSPFLKHNKEEAKKVEAEEKEKQQVRLEKFIMGIGKVPLQDFITTTDFLKF